MHQSHDHDKPSAESRAMRQRIRRALASDLQLPEQHPAITSTLRALAFAARQHDAITSSDKPAVNATTFDLWRGIVDYLRSPATKQKPVTLASRFIP